MGEWSSEIPERAGWYNVRWGDEMTNLDSHAERFAIVYYSGDWKVRTVGGRFGSDKEKVKLWGPKIEVQDPPVAG